MSNEGQVSETSMMTPEDGPGDTPGTEDGVPPAYASRQEADGSPVENKEGNRTDALQRD